VVAIISFHMIAITVFLPISKLSSFKFPNVSMHLFAISGTQNHKLLCPTDIFRLMCTIFMPLLSLKDGATGNTVFGSVHPRVSLCIPKTL